MPTVEQRRAGTLAEVLTSPESFASTLTTILVDEYGTEALAWDPATIALELHDDFGVTLPQANFDRLMAGMALLTTDRFYKDLPAFVTLCNVLSGGAPPVDTWDPADAMECAWGITEALLLSPPEPEDEEPFCDEIRLYIGRVLEDEGILSSPDVLGIALPVQQRTPAPHVASATREVELARSQELTDIIKDSLRRLMDQITELPLSSGNVAGLLDRLHGKER